MSGGALGSILGKFLPDLIKVANPVLKNVALTLGLSAAMSGINKKIHGYGTTVIFSNKEINDMIKIVKALEYSDFLVKGSTKTLQNDVKKGGGLPILPMLLRFLGVFLLSARGLYRAGGHNKCNCETNYQGKGLHRAGEGKGLFRAGQGILKKALMPPHPLTNSEMQNYY